MIESALIFSLGFLAAVLLALLAAPAYRRRTVRLTRRRIEATVPLTREEILAEKDRLRAEHAMEIRRIEIAAKALRETNSHQMIELGRARVALAQTTDERQRHGSSLASTERRIADMKEAVLRGEARTAELERSLAAAQAAAEVRAGEVEALGRQLGEALLTSSNRQIELLARETELERLRGEIVVLKDAADRRVAAADEALAAAHSGRADEINALREQLDEAVLVSSNLQLNLLARATEIEGLQAELADLRFDAARRGETADQAVAASRMDRDSSALLPSAPDMPLSDDERGRLQDRLTVLMRENRRLKEERAESEGKPQSVGAAVDDSVLRDRLAAMAAEVVALAAALEGPASPIPSLLENAPPGSADGPSLAERVRALQHKAAGSQP